MLSGRTYRVAVSTRDEWQGRECKVKAIVLLSVILIVSTMARAQGSVPTPPAGVPAHNRCAVGGVDEAARRIAEEWKSGYNSGDVGKVTALYTEDAYYLTQHFVTGVVHGRANIKAYVQRGVAAGYHIDSIQIIATDCSGDLAYAVGRYEATNAGQKALGVNLVVLKRFGDRWRIVAHEAAVPDPATAIQRLDGANAN